MKRRVRTTCPRDCYDGCGIVVEWSDEGSLRVLGDPDHPVSRGKLCGKCALAYNGVWRDPASRLAMPLRRTGPKGPGGHFEETSWSEALSAIAGRLQSVPGDRVLHAHYTGTCSVVAGDFPMRFFHRLGAVEVEPDTICNNAGHYGLGYVLGTSVEGFDPRSIRDSRCVVVWGANPSASAPHAHEHWLKQSPGPVVVIDPVRHATAREADIHLQPFPGSDAALAFGLMHVSWREGLLDESFIAERTLGFDEMLPAIEAATPEWTSQQTGVPATSIEEVARLYAGGPSLLWLGQGLQRQPRGGNVMRACAALSAVTGNLGKPGAGLCYLNGAGPRNLDYDYTGAAHLSAAHGAEPPRSISHMELVPALADAQRSQAFFCWNMNVAASGPRQRELREALSREDLFTVVVDLFQTDTADYADFILPAASFLEFDDLVVPYFHMNLSAQVKVEDPPGEALPNSEIFRRLARAMGFEEPELYESDRAIVDTLLERTGLGIGWEELARRGTIEPFEQPIVPFADGKFPTRSGKVELASSRAEAHGHPRVPEASADERPPPGTLRLLSPASRWLMNDSYGNDSNILRQLGEPQIYLNAADAMALKLVDGEPACVFNATGRLRLRVCVSDDIAPGVALVHKGRWAKLSGGDSVNALNPGVVSDMGESSSVHGTLVQVTPV